MAGPQKSPPTVAALPSRLIERQSSELREAEVLDPYAMGWDAAGDLDEPPPCPFCDGVKAKLWRAGFSARVQEYIGRRMSSGGLQANLTA
jgi:hypothetical protein